MTSSQVQFCIGAQVVRWQFRHHIQQMWILWSSYQTRWYFKTRVCQNFCQPVTMTHCLDKSSTYFHQCMMDFLRFGSWVMIISPSCQGSRTSRKKRAKNTSDKFKKRITAGGNTGVTWQRGEHTGAAKYTQGGETMKSGLHRLRPSESSGHRNW